MEIARLTKIIAIVGIVLLLALALVPQDADAFVKKTQVKTSKLATHNFVFLTQNYAPQNQGQGQDQRQSNGPVQGNGQNNQGDQGQGQGASQSQGQGEGINYVELKIEEYYEYDNHVVTLKNVGSATPNTPVIVNVDGVVETVASGILENVNGVDILVTSTKYSDDWEQRSATFQTDRQVEIKKPVVHWCSDTIDNDGDGRTDLGDPGCSSGADDDESDDPPAPEPTPGAITLKVGETTSFNGKTITLKNVNTGGSVVIVDVDGTVKTISTTGTETVNGVTITVITAAYYDDLNKRSAEFQFS